MDRLVAAAGVILLLAAVGIIVYYAITVPVESSFGERYVINVISPPPPLNEITTFKPVTLMTYFFFAGIIFILEATKHRLGRINSRSVRAVLITASFAAGYEFIWNMFAWFTTWFKNGGVLDLTANNFHDHIFPPVNYNFATKVSFLIFALCLYCWHFLRTTDAEERQSKRLDNLERPADKTR